MGPLKEGVLKFNIRDTNTKKIVSDESIEAGLSSSSHSKSCVTPALQSRCLHQEPLPLLLPDFQKRFETLKAFNIQDPSTANFDGSDVAFVAIICSASSRSSMYFCDFLSFAASKPVSKQTVS